jgi:hypothetical protein
MRAAFLFLLGLACVACAGFGLARATIQGDSICPSNNFTYCPPAGQGGNCTIASGVCDDNSPYASISQGASAFVNECTEFANNTCTIQTFTCVKSYYKTANCIAPVQCSTSSMADYCQ